MYGDEMPQLYHIEGYKNFYGFLEAMKPDKERQSVNVLFCGSKLRDGKSWCPDCVEADPVIESSLQALPPGSYFIKVEVGTRLEWRDPDCPFRKDPDIKLTALPTLMKWGGRQRLVGEQLLSKRLVEAFLKYQR